MRISSLGCFNRTFNSRIGPAIENVVEHRAVKKRSVLRHQTDRCAQAFLRHSCYILTVNVDVAFLYVVEPQQELDEGRFPGTRSADESNTFAGTDHQRQPFDDPRWVCSWRAFRTTIVKTDRIEANVAIRHD